MRSREICAIAVISPSGMQSCIPLWRSRESQAAETHQVTYPPSTIKSDPVAKAAASDARKTADPTRSSVHPIQPIGVALIQKLCSCRSLSDSVSGIWM